MLSDHIDGQLSPAQAQALEKHLAGCPACSAELDALRQTVALVKRLPRVAAPSGILAAVRFRIAADRSPHSRILHLFERPEARAALVAAMVLIVFTYGYLELATSPTTDATDTSLPNRPARRKIPSRLPTAPLKKIEIQEQRTQDTHDRLKPKNTAGTEDDRLWLKDAPASTMTRAEFETGTELKEETARVHADKDMASPDSNFSAPSESVAAPPIQPPQPMTTPQYASRPKGARLATTAPDAEKFDLAELPISDMTIQVTDQRALRLLLDRYMPGTRRGAGKLRATSTAHYRVDIASTNYAAFLRDLGNAGRIIESRDRDPSDEPTVETPPAGHISIRLHIANPGGIERE